MQRLWQETHQLAYSVDHAKDDTALYCCDMGAEESCPIIKSPMLCYQLDGR